MIQRGPFNWSCGHPQEDWNISVWHGKTGARAGRTGHKCKLCSAWNTAQSCAVKGDYTPPTPREQWEELFTHVLQGRATCAAPLEPHSRPLHVDHDHATGRIRGILCSHHNQWVIPVLEITQAKNWATIQSWLAGYLGDGLQFVRRGPWINIWGTPTIHPSVRVGAYTEIGDAVVLEEGVVVGFGCFIPPKVRIQRGVWIGPRVTFTNDKYPPSDTLSYTIVEPEVVIGAGAVILPGIILGRGCRVGAGAVVTKSVPPGITVVGNPAAPIGTHTIKTKLDAILDHAKQTEERYLGAR